MAAKVGRVTTKTGGDALAAMVSAGEGFAAPPEFTASTTVTDDRVGELEVSVDVEVSDGRARARRVCVGSGSERGVSATALRAVPTREVVASAVASVLMRVELTAKGARLEPANHKTDAAARDAVLRIVGYVDEVPS
jgi:hypothetical protein